MEQSIYQAPASDVILQDDQPLNGSIDKAVTGNYHFSISETLSEAWEKTTGAKIPIHLGYLVIVGVCIAFGIVALIGGSIISVITSLLAPVLAIAITPVMTIALLVAGMGVIACMWTGLFMIGVHRAAELNTSAGATLQYFNRFWPVLAVYILSSFIINIGFALLIIPGLYFAIAYLFALPLCADKKLSIWDSLETSRKAVTFRWFGFFGLFIALMLINAIAAIPLGIGLIWTIPMTHVALGIAYRNMFGVQPEASSI